MQKPIVPLVLEGLQQNVNKQEMTCSEILKYINKHVDPEDEFFFSTSKEYYPLVDDLFKYRF